MNLFQLGDFTLNSGAKSRWKLECDSLTDADVEGLAEMIRQLVGPFCHCIGVPRGGLRLQRALSPRATVPTPASGELPVLVVDDVLTTAGSITREVARWREEGDLAEKYPAEYAEILRTKPGEWTRTVRVVGAVVFARGPCPPWVRALFTMPEALWVPPRGKTGGRQGTTLW